MMILESLGMLNSVWHVHLLFCFGYRNEKHMRTEMRWGRIGHTHTHIQPMDVISCVADSININRNWRFRFIAHYYWFLLHSLTKAIENQKDRCYIFFLFCCVSLQFPLEMPTHNRKSERKNNLRNTNRLHSSNGMLFVHKRKSWVSVCFSWLILLWNGIYVSIYP